jgi:hypothetical protein
MFRTLIGFAIFAMIALFVLKFLGAFVFVGIGLFFTLLKLAFLGFCFYFILKIFAPDTARRVKETIKGEQSIT